MALFMEKLFSADYDELKNIISFVKDGLHSEGIENELLDTIHVISDEIITNVIKNAYKMDSPDFHEVNDKLVEKPLLESFHKLPDISQIIIEFTDWGIPFNPLDHELTVPDKEFNGGFGIFIAKSLADKIKYRRELGKNILTVLIKSK